MTHTLRRTLQSSGYPGPLDDADIAQIKTALAELVPAVLEIMDRRLHEGRFPIATASEIQSLFEADATLSEVPPVAMMEAIFPFIPDAFPGTGFRLETTPLEIRVSRCGSIGPVPAAVRKAGTSRADAEAFLSGRAGSPARLHYLLKLDQSYPWVFFPSDLLDVSEARVVDLMGFYDFLDDIKNEIIRRMTDTVLEIDLGDLIQQIGLSRLEHLPRPRDPQALQILGENHRLISYLLKARQPDESEQAMLSRQIMTIIAILLHDRLGGEKIQLLPLTDRWGPGDRRIHLRSYRPRAVAQTSAA